jgi:hypothetical protein
VEGPLGPSLLHIRRPLREMLVRAVFPFNHLLCFSLSLPAQSRRQRGVPRAPIAWGEARSVGGGFAHCAHRIYVE